LKLLYLSFLKKKLSKIISCFAKQKRESALEIGQPENQRTNIWCAFTVERAITGAWTIAVKPGKKAGWF
jgi:hypothetical protein